MENSTDNLKSILNTLCKISMCDPKESTNFDAIDDMYKSYGVEKFVIEFGTLNPEILVTVGQHIRLDDVIAKMKNIDVKSKVCGTITEVNERYIIGTYDTDIDAILSSYGLGEDMTESDILKQFNIKI